MRHLKVYFPFFQPGQQKLAKTITGLVVQLTDPKSNFLIYALFIDFQCESNKLRARTSKSVVVT